MAPTLLREPAIDRSVTFEEAVRPCYASHFRNAFEARLGGRWPKSVGWVMPPSVSTPPRSAGQSHPCCRRIGPLGVPLW